MRAEQWAEERAVVYRPQVVALRAAERVAWQHLQTAAAWGSGTATYRAALRTWRAVRYDLDRALVPPPRAQRRRPGAQHGGPLCGARMPRPGRPFVPPVPRAVSE
jgi:hypothetical protein